MSDPRRIVTPARLTRRTFVRNGACALVGIGSVPRFLVRTAAAASANRKTLVAVFQRGAVDGLSMVPPHGDPAYLAARRSIGLQRPARGDAERAIDLDGFFALHPALSPLVPLWTSSALAVVHACGSPDTTRSHFDAQDYMESGTPGLKSTETGWLGRAIGATPERSSSPFRAVALSARLPRTLRGAPGAVAMTSLDRFDVRTGDGNARRGFEAMYADGVRDVLHGTGRETFEAVRLLRAATAGRTAPANGSEYPRTRFGEAMRQIAQLIRSDVGLEVAFADVEGWDTHVAQGAERGQLATRLGEFAGALAAFARDLGDQMADVVVLTMSEFGRTVAENGNRGTDHGHATAMLVLGGGVRGGRVYGRWPGLAREQLFESRDLAVTTDFRALFGEVATRHLGLPADAPLFPGWTPPRVPLGVLG
jgi:uncharacterized protein (DUF1501 family)